MTTLVDSPTDAAVSPLTAAGARAELAATFLGNGANYDRYRPGFPLETVRRVAAARGGLLGDVLDLGAGTGKLTELLASRADAVTAIDPSADMLAQLSAKLPSVDTRVGLAEDLPLASGSVDVVTVAQAFHWFDRDAASAEIARVLRPGGVLAIVWTVPDPRCAWDRACYRLAHPPRDLGDDDGALALGGDVHTPALPGFETLRGERLRWSEHLTRSDYLQRWGTVSTLLASSDAQRAATLAGMEAILDADPDSAGRQLLKVRHVTEVITYRVR
ncbi:class I SAM-dependent methyltransferase [Galactobacter valiniphilus]|uniref:class I SAM-dependent methyltransferase n=1 Tax=Galactobacter valiniphilus TaxID=2676122 RepID=UPI003735BABA